MEVLKIIVGICFIFLVALFSIGMIQDLIEQIKLAKLRKKWAAEQKEERYQRKIKLSCCKTCERKKNCTDYFGSECIYNSKWLCEGPAAPEEPIIKVEASEDWVKVTRCKDCVYWENDHCNYLKINVTNPDWFCRAGMNKKGDK